MRTGIIISYNNTVRHGFIKDSNDQKIRFHIEDDKEIFKRFDVVEFNIAFICDGLQAVDIIHLIDMQGKPIAKRININ